MFHGHDIHLLPYSHEIYMFSCRININDHDTAQVYGHEKNQSYILKWIQNNLAKIWKNKCYCHESSKTNNVAANCIVLQLTNNAHVFQFKDNSWPLNLYILKLCKSNLCTVVTLEWSTTLEPKHGLLICLLKCCFCQFFNGLTL